MNLAVLFSSMRPFFPGGRLTQGQVEGVEIILKEIGTGLTEHKAYTLATAQWETANTMQPIYERGKVSYFDKYEPGTKLGKALGNIEKGDGYRFRGRGFVQITGRRNYGFAGYKIGIDLIADPDKALDPHVASVILWRGMSEGWFTGRKLSNYLPGNYRDARRIVNGTDRAREIANLASRWETALRRA
ncbi:carboxypeptidase [Paracoccus denitrificans]|uniref:glycoside hydrolase family 19 protein n=1 Tax=Paracoccus denitrificans TaxID=266 RepID=UPI001E4AABC8|nr:glycoside hydrolase family 19 protein [Paracoccus denitrificans]UFS66946.1 carboxypeptidase [Paracoccus denitrificans]